MSCFVLWPLHFSFGQPAVEGAPALLFNALRGPLGPAGVVLDFLYLGNQSDNDPISILYVIIPWIGVMAAGYAFGAILTMEPERRKKLCYWIGGGAGPSA